MNPTRIFVFLFAILVAELASARVLPASVHTSINDQAQRSNLHPAQLAANRLRRKVGGYDGPGPLEYMEMLRERLADQEEVDATAAWGLLDAGT